MLRMTSVALAAASLVGCTTFNREFKEPKPVDKFPTQTTPRTMERSDSLVNPSDESISIDETSFMVRPMKPQGTSLPDFYVYDMAATESGVQDALQLMLEGTGLTLNIEGGPRGMERFGATSIQGVRGSLRQVLDILSDQVGFFWSSNGGVLTIEPDQVFVVELPPVLAEDSLASMANTMQYLGARDTYLDRLARTIVFRANRKALKQIDQYLDGIRSTRSMLVYEIQVFQVDLTDGNTQGVSWGAASGSNLARPKNVTDGVSSVAADLAKSFGLTATGAGLGAVIMGPKFSVDALVEFLKTQGSVRTVSQPRLAMLNGSRGMLRVGQTTTYVSRVGSNVSSGVSQVTVETKDLRTGLELGVTGEEHDGTIYTRVSLGLSELVRFNKYTTLGTDLNLPDVADRELKTAIRLPAGYTALLGGITVNRESDDRKSGIQDNSKAQAVQRSEIVMVVKPTIVRFKKRAAPTAVAAPKGDEPTSATRQALLTPKSETPLQLAVPAAHAAGTPVSEPAASPAVAPQPATE